MSARGTAGAPRRVGLPERLFGVKVTAEPDTGRRHGAMASGAWMHGPDGAPSGAALGVLIDDTLGIAAAARQPDGFWTVTTELSIDYVAPPPCDGTLIRSEGGVVARDSGGALATGTVADETGRALAVMSLRSRYVPGVPDLSLAVVAGTASDGAGADAPPRRESLVAMLGASISDDGQGVRLRVPGDENLTNASGVLHGGVALCASQLAATRWLSADAGMGLASTRITYLRRLEISGDIEFVARVVHGGRSLCVVEVVAYGPSGKPCTTATVTGYAASAPGALVAV